MPVTKIHQSGKKIIIVLAGGGSEVIGKLLRHGGASNSILDIQVPYSQKAFINYIGGKPDKFVSEDAAAHLAAAAFEKGRLLAPDEDIVSIASTSSLAKDNERPDRVHKIYLASQNAKKLTTVEVEIKNTKVREEQEKINAEAILNLIAFSCELENLNFSSQTYSSEILNYFNHELWKHAWCKPKKALYEENAISRNRNIIFPGSFNPIHKSHLKMIEIASKKFKSKVDLELSIENFEKPRLNYKTINERINCFKEHKNEYIGNLWFTTTPLFYNKAELFPNSTFIVGMDTMNRIMSCYKNKLEYIEAKNQFKYYDIDWLVFPRGNLNLDKNNDFDIEIVSKEEYDPKEFNDSSRNIRNS